MMALLRRRWPQIAVLTLTGLAGATGWWAGSVNSPSVQVKAPAHSKNSSAKTASPAGLNLPEPPDILTPAELVVLTPPPPAPVTAPYDDVATRKVQAALLADRTEIKDDPMIAAWEVTMRRPPKFSPSPLTPPDWKITGVMQRGADQEVIVQRGNDPKPYFHKVGDALPGGARIAWVKPDAVGLILPKHKVVAVPLVGQ